MDSSAIVACMSRITPDPVKTFTVGYSGDPASSELEYARIVAKHFKTEHHEFVLSADDFFESLELLLTHAREEHAIVLLSGEGGMNPGGVSPPARKMPSAAGFFTSSEIKECPATADIDHQSENTF